MYKLKLIALFSIGLFIGVGLTSSYFLFVNPVYMVDNELIVATTTSTYDSGLLDNITPHFLQDHPGVNVSFIAVGTGQAISTAKLGDADLIIIHDRIREESFVNDGYGIHRVSVMYNDFVIVGPMDTDPANILGLANVTEAFLRINETGSNFASRGDGSGTHAAELRIWNKANVNVSTVPPPSWYIETGQGMGSTLTVASDEQRYCLTDRGTFTALKDSLDLRIMVEGDRILLNPYGVIPVDLGRFPHINFQLAVEFVLFLISDQGATLINNYRVNGEQLFKHHYGNTTNTIGETQENQTSERNYWDALLLDSTLYSRSDNTLGADLPALAVSALIIKYQDQD